MDIIYTLIIKALSNHKNRYVSVLTRITLNISVC